MRRDKDHACPEPWAAMRFSFGYTGLRVRDLEACLRFFKDGLGLKERGRWEVPETKGVYVDLVGDDEAHFIELNWYEPGSRFASPYEPGEALDHLQFRLEGGSLRDAIAHLERHGGRLRIPPFREGPSTLAYVDSPDGHTVELSEPAGA
jgi:lactoylglutathione lyase